MIELLITETLTGKTYQAPAKVEKTDTEELEEAWGMFVTFMFLVPLLVCLMEYAQ